ncbi:MAG: glycosyltransferase family 4 protein [Peptostreptococcaceae bacterium]|nr:glycosyltransferase family 4 protein [Peptostreptococcaceae bacterium]
MNILHILPMNKLSGAEKLALILCKNMKKYNPIVICGGEDLKNIFVNNGIKAYSLDFQSENRKNILKQIKNRIDKDNIKIVHAHDNNASVNGLLTKKIYGLKVKVISHIHSCYPWIDGINKNKVIDSLFRRKYDHNIACGKIVYDFYEKNTNYINENNTSILSNAIDIKEIDNRSDRDSLDIYNQFNIPKDKIILGYVGRLIELKGLIPFIKKVKEHEFDLKDCKILLIGNGPQENEIKELIEKLQLNDLFILVGHQEDVYKFYPIIDIFLLPSKYEGLPMVILEAMSFNKPIVAMNVGSINEVVRSNYNGYLIDPNNYDEFILKLIDLKNSKEQIKYYGENSKAIIESNYGIDKYVDRIISIYDKVLE